MSYKEKEVSYVSHNTYSTLNTLTKKTKNVWFVCHGMGYLSRYFIKYFDDLNPDENYIIAPQAPSKYYQWKDFKHVGASWLTKENTAFETKNVLSYLESVLKQEQLENSSNLIVLGFSQGVSVAMRWVAHYKINCKALIMHSGGIPKELRKEDFEFLDLKVKAYLIYGTEDEFITEERAKTERDTANALFEDKLVINSFEGVHEVNIQLLKVISKDF